MALDEANALIVELYEHLEYCGWGDNWERQCAYARGLPDRVEAYIEKHTFVDGRGEE